MQKVLFIIGVFVLGTFVYWETAKSQPMIDDLLLKNVEALASAESTLPVFCEESGNVTCPGIGAKFKTVYEGYSWGFDEETY